MRKLKVIDFDRNHLGTIVQESGGQLRLEVVKEEYRKQLEAFLKRITTEPVYLIGGEQIEKDGKRRFIRRRKQVRPEDEDFLLGVQLLLNKTRFGETRLRGLVLHEGERHE